ncbi:hypothetical protein MJO28_008762 [Puccinia striiformis f. sp. tritici]|uniref:Uncharacterized protein n=4 Tax=Puccinia striiformis TaxID=27350 RepID=A0A0L0V9W2_9BASI|nr:hypothetical protein MJO28_008762 [Puccinia striiformis f. sp. tritici]KAI7953009.1 hypothetical protein MJO29_008640 [Puccinia striiformis f. sp. tritici]KNE96077.1 hypothetical protein PSTG_10649 [Puccinia striiformis f. sp. tritici PST-78]POW05725.1 hypothetical protein PSHT_10655 [Puccinia striiformis]POW16882.1 hypothetical protein PSTT_01003 [Puccinia striiformis]
MKVKWIEEDSTSTTSINEDDSTKQQEDDEDPILFSLGPDYSSFKFLLSIPDTHLNKDSTIISQLQFSFHPLEFHRFVSHTLRFWNREPEPVGVDIHHSDECLPCEFKDDCEWRSKLSKKINSIYS